MLIFVACIDVIITLITLILLLFIIEIIIPINVILMMMIIINACYRFDQWFTHCLSITLQHEINYSLKKKKKRKGVVFKCVIVLFSVLSIRTQAEVQRALTIWMCLPTHTKSPSTQAVTRQHDGHFNSVHALSLSLPLSLALWILYRGHVIPCCCC